MVSTSRLHALLGCPWQLAEKFLQAASIPYKTVLGENYNRFFSLQGEALYVGRVRYMEEEGVWEILLYKTMVTSSFHQLDEVTYAKFLSETEERVR